MSDYIIRVCDGCHSEKRMTTRVAVPTWYADNSFDSVKWLDLCEECRESYIDDVEEWSDMADSSTCDEELSEKGFITVEELLESLIQEQDAKRDEDDDDGDFGDDDPKRPEEAETL